MDILRVENLIRNYKTDDSEDIKVLKNLSFSVEETEFVGIMGKSGCGKTTLLKVLGMIDAATEGTVYFKDKDVRSLNKDSLADIRRCSIGFVFQDFYLMNSLTVQENIMLPMILDKNMPAKAREKARKCAESFNIEKLLGKNPYELSGGEKQRVAICRALINDPDLILADEPTGNLDSKSGKIVIDTLCQINRKQRKTIVMVTHDPQMASCCKRVIFLKDGAILDVIKNDEEKDVFYQTILGRMTDL